MFPKILWFALLGLALLQIGSCQTDNSKSVTKSEDESSSTVANIFNAILSILSYPFRLIGQIFAAIFGGVFNWVTSPVVEVCHGAGCTKPISTSGSGEKPQTIVQPTPAN